MSEFIDSRQAAEIYPYHPSWFLAIARLRLVEPVKRKPIVFRRSDLEAFLIGITTDDLIAIRAHINRRKSQPPLAEKQKAGGETE